MCQDTKGIGHDNRLMIDQITLKINIIGRKVWTLLVWTDH